MGLLVSPLLMGSDCDNDEDDVDPPECLAEVSFEEASNLTGIWSAGMTVEIDAGGFPNFCAHSYAGIAGAVAEVGNDNGVLFVCFYDRWTIVETEVGYLEDMCIRHIPAGQDFRIVIADENGVRYNMDLVVREDSFRIGGISAYGSGF